MAEIFEIEKQIIKSKILHLAHLKLSEVSEIIPGISPAEFSEISKTVAEILKETPGVSKDELRKILVIYPLTLSVIWPNFSRQRLEILIETVIEIIKKDPNSFWPQL